MLQDNERGHELFAAFDAGFSLIRVAQFARSSIPTAEQSRCAALIRWLIRELRGWRSADDPSRGMIVAMFVVAQRCDVDNTLWPLMPHHIAANGELIAYLQGLVASFGATLTPAGPHTPIWEQEALAFFNKADAEGDWAAIIRCWERFPPFFPNALQTQAVQCLCRYDMARLAKSVANLRQTIVVMLVAEVLAREQRLQLGIASDNPYVQLAVAYRTFSGSRRRHRPDGLEVGDQQLLTRLLLKVAGDPSRWRAWMDIFNANPGHYPALQAPLAAALAIAPEAAIEDYVAAIRLAQQEPNRQSVARCLRVFRANASPKRRAVLWTHAYKRWRAWSFAYADPNQPLMTITRCELDYAIVAYAAECMDEAGRAGELQDIRERLFVLDGVWHELFTDILSSWNCLSSQFQPYAHATGTAGTEVDWLCEIEKTYWPFDQAQERYLMMKYRVLEA